MQSYVATQKHGKLVVDGTLYPKSYGTNVGEQCAPSGGHHAWLHAELACTRPWHPAPAAAA